MWRIVFPSSFVNLIHSATFYFYIISEYFNESFAREALFIRFVFFFTFLQQQQQKMREFLLLAAQLHMLHCWLLSSKFNGFRRTSVWMSFFVQCTCHPTVCQTVGQRQFRHCSVKQVANEDKNESHQIYIIRMKRLNFWCIHIVHFLLCQSFHNFVAIKLIWLPGLSLKTDSTSAIACSSTMFLIFFIAFSFVIGIEIIRFWYWFWQRSLLQRAKIFGLITMTFWSFHSYRKRQNKTRLAELDN